jgi:hypothetical protein
MLLSAALYYAHKNRLPITIQCSPQARIPANAFVLEVDGKRAFLDYNDDYELRPIGLQMDMYGKRSLTMSDAAEGIVPLGFHFNYSFGLHRLLWKKGFFHSRNRVEILRSLDWLRITNMSHLDMRVPHLFSPPADHGGKVIFYTRLWDPSRGTDQEERKRRHHMNEMRIQIVRTLRRMENNVSGIFPDTFARHTCPELLVPEEETTKQNYLSKLRSADIGIANEGLKGSPGWKIGEYVVGSKCIISTAVAPLIPAFDTEVNYLVFDDPNEIPEIVMQLRKGKKYLRMGEKNWQYCLKYLHPDVYFERILRHLVNKSSEK